VIQPLEHSISGNTAVNAKAAIDEMIRQFDFVKVLDQFHLLRLSYFSGIRSDVPQVFLKPYNSHFHLSTLLAWFGDFADLFITG
jgi:hypothetical protein